MRYLKIVAVLFCGIASMLCCLGQFRCATLLPLVIAITFVCPIWWLHRRGFRWAILLPLFTFFVLVADAFAFRHYLAVSARIWSPFFGSPLIEDTLVSPSGHTTAYIIDGGFLDSAYCIYFSTRGLFPVGAIIDLETNNASYPRDVFAIWHGNFFTAGQRLVSVAFDERQDKIYTYYEWLKGPVSPHSPQKTREAFSSYISSFY